MNNICYFNPLTTGKQHRTTQSYLFECGIDKLQIMLNLHMHFILRVPAMQCRHTDLNLNFFMKFENMYKLINYNFEQKITDLFLPTVEHWCF